MQADPEYAKLMDDILSKDVAAHMQSGASALKNPPGTVWHHPVENPSVMRLLQQTEHTTPQLQPVLHPDGIGGYGTFYGN